MKKLALLIGACALSASAHAELVAKKGTKATLRVEYIFSSSGSYFSPSKDQKRKWKLQRVVNLTATYAADAAQPFGVMHAKDPSQQTLIKEQETKVNAMAAQMQPMMGDMMKIAADCNNDEKCIEAKLSAYANKMGKPTDVPQKQAAIADLARPNAPEYQLWRSTGQSGLYTIREDSTFEVFDLTCPGDKYCKRKVTTKGDGPIPDPPGRSIAGASMFEVDGWKGDLVLQLPVPLQALPTETVVESNIAHDEVKSGKGFAKPMLVNVEPLTVKFKNDRVEASGTKRIPVEGKFEEGGLLTITWSLTTQQ
jgi:hypothetical protein